ncbi:MAG: Lrp/AsnC family transcriptional regulator [Candidatus Bathyarchaeia archaeon]
MSTQISLEDEEWVIKGPHHYLVERRPLNEIEDEIYRLLREAGPMPLSAIWRRLNCHLWEVVEALRRLKEKGIVEETDIAQWIYQK